MQQRQERRPKTYSRPNVAVWETTLKCNLACIHCGSRAGPARDRELTTAEALDLVRQLDDLGFGEVVLIGGEAYLRRDWLEIATAITARGMRCGLVTGGYGISREVARRMKDAGFYHVSVSIDGLEASHDRQRGRKGSWQACFRTLEFLREAGVSTGCNTQLNRLSAPEIPRLYELICESGATDWQIQLTNPMGNAADNPWLILQPAELLDLYPMLARVVRRANAEGVNVWPASNLYYFGPYADVIWEYPHSLGLHFMGPVAGLAVVAIESDGKIKGDPSLPTAAYTGGNLRDRSLREILETWELTFNRGGGTAQGTAHLWGFCKTCPFAEVCRGGCSWTAHVFFGRRGNNPFCHARALLLAKKGRRERIELKTRAPGVPFDHGVFEVIEEPFDAPWPDGDEYHFVADKVSWPESYRSHPPV